MPFLFIVIIAILFPLFIASVWAGGRVVDRKSATLYVDEGLLRSLIGDYIYIAYSTYTRTPSSSSAAGSRRWILFSVIFPRISAALNDVGISGGYVRRGQCLFLVFLSVTGGCIGWDGRPAVHVTSTPTTPFTYAQQHQLAGHRKLWGFQDAQIQKEESITLQPS